MKLFYVLISMFLCLSLFANERTLKLDGTNWRVKEKAPGLWQDYYIDGMPAQKMVVFSDDFLFWDSGHYVTTEVNANSTQVLADARNGILVLAAASALENEGSQIQLGNGTTGESFAPAAGKNLWFETYIATNDADQNDIYIGFHNQDTTIVGGLGTDYIGFNIVDGSASISCLSAASSVVTTSSAVATAIDGTYIKLGIKVTGISKIEFYINNSKLATHTTSIPTALMQISAGHLTGETTANTLSIDYIVGAQSR